MKQVRDHYFHKAKREGFAARSAYKLEEIDRKQRLLRPGQRVLDLGCAPGSWLQYAITRVGPKGYILGIDTQAVSIVLPPHARVLQADVFGVSPNSLDKDGKGFDVVLSDMAPRTTGIAGADAERSAELALHALALARVVLRPGGDLLAKVFQGARLPEVRKAFTTTFDRVSLKKPSASRSESVEIFLLAQGLRKTQSPHLAPEQGPPAETSAGPEAR